MNCSIISDLLVSQPLTSHRHFVRPVCYKKDTKSQSLVLKFLFLELLESAILSKRTIIDLVCFVVLFELNSPEAHRSD